MILRADRLGKRFGSKTIFKNVSFELSAKSIHIISGPNGSGKSTLVKILSGLIPASSGHIEWSDGPRRIDRIGVAAPYIPPFLEMTALQMIRLSADAKHLQLSTDDIYVQLAQFQLKGQATKVLRSYSSGMLQRLKLLIAALHQPDLLIVDEPTANLDVDGVDFVHAYLESYARERTVLMATNDPLELKMGEIRVRFSA